MKELDGIKYWYISGRTVGVCAWCCGKLPNGEWNYKKMDEVTKKIEELTGKGASHGMCEECAEKY